MANNITYANKVALNENPSVADINKVKADDMNKIKQVVNGTILNLLFGVGTNTWSSSDTYSINEVVIYDYLLYANITGKNKTTPPNKDTTNWQQISLLTNNMKNIVELNEKLNKDVYSTTEVKTNKVWIDGKPIYRKSISFSNVSTGTATTIDTLSDVDTFFVNSNMSYCYDNNLTYTIPKVHLSNTNANLEVRFQKSSGNVSLGCGTQNDARSGILTVEYTKTTD